MAFTNLKKQFDLKDKNLLQECLDFVESTLTGLGIARSTVLKTMMTAEDTILQLTEHGASEGSLRIRISKSFGNAVIRISAPGTAFNPYAGAKEGLSDLEEVEDEEAAEAIRSIFLKAMGENLKFGHKNGVNKVRILVGVKENPLLKYTMIALVLGLVFGFLMQSIIPAAVSNGLSDILLSPIKTVFMNALKIIIAPVVFFSIVSCLAQFKDLSQLGRIGTRVMGMYLLTTVIAVVMAMGVFQLIRPGAYGFALSGVQDMVEVDVDTNVDTSILHTIMDIVPNNFMRPFLENSTLQVMFLAFLCGIAVGMIGEYSEVLANFFEACNSLFLTITAMITKFIPLAVFCSMALMVRNIGGASLLSVLGMVGTTLLGLLCMLVIYGLLVLILGRLNPITFFKKNREGMLTSFSLSSSSAAMPTNMRTCSEKMGISTRVCSFSIPLGATVNMDGTCVVLVMIGLFLARAYAVEVPSSLFLSLTITIILLSLGTPGVPGAGIVCAGVVLAAIGVPMEGLGIIMGIYPLLDMFVTMSNTTGDVATALIVARREGLLDLEKFKK